MGVAGLVAALGAVVVLLAVGCCMQHSAHDEGMPLEVCAGMLATLTAVLFVALALKQQVLPELVPVVHRVPTHLLDPPPRYSFS